MVSQLKNDLSKPKQAQQKNPIVIGSRFFVTAYEKVN